MFNALKSGLGSFFAGKSSEALQATQDPINNIKAELEELVTAVQNSETSNARQKLLEQIFERLGAIEPGRIDGSKVPTRFPQTSASDHPDKFVDYKYKIFIAEDTTLIINCRIPTLSEECKVRLRTYKYDLLLFPEEASYSFSLLRQSDNTKDDLQKASFFEKRKLSNQGAVFKKEIKIASGKLPDAELFNSIRAIKKEQYQNSLTSFMDIVEKVLKEPVTTLCLGKKVLDWKITEQQDIRTYSIDYQGVTVKISANVDSKNPEQLGGTALLYNPQISFKQRLDYSDSYKYRDNPSKINYQYNHSWYPGLRIDNPIQTRLVELSSRAALPMLGAIEAGRENYRREYVGIADQTMEKMLRYSDKNLRSLEWHNDELEVPQLMQFSSIYRNTAKTSISNGLRFEMDYETGMDANREVSVSLFIGNVLLNKLSAELPSFRFDYKHGTNSVLDFYFKFFNLKLDKMNAQSLFKLSSQEAILK
jgi:hypothetical protein